MYHMDVISGLILGIVQGLTEFVPISSSGHLILVRDALGLATEHGLAFDAVLHLATAFAVLVYFRRDVWQALTGKNTKLLFALIFGTIPAVVLGFAFQGYLETVTRSPMVVAWMLVLGSLLFVAAEWLGTQTQQLSPKKGWWIGLYQALALVPGVSRSGASISGGLLFGLSREEATRFAFLLSFPVLFGVGILKLFELGSVGFDGGLGLSLLFSSAVAFVVGLLAIHFMVQFLKNHRLYIFAVYRIVLAGIVFLMF